MRQIIIKIFPENINNHYQGQKIALYVFYLVTAFTLWRSQHHLFSADGGAQSIATIPLDSFSKDGAAAVIGVFGLWGLSQLIIGLLYLIVCLRYRAMLPLMYLLMFFEYFVRATYFPAFKPIPTSGTAPGAVGNFPLIIISLIMFVLSLLPPKKKVVQSLE
ncbi:MAG: hypothetical protein CL609_05680 [Anaerolineaceae bacterium]|nr:hypothetical protein [Anaerolineaceae bacterium]